LSCPADGSQGIQEHGLGLGTVIFYGGGAALMEETPKITTDQPIECHLAAGCLMSHMFFPDNAERCRTNEIIFRINFADWWSGQVVQLGKEELERRILLAVDSGFGGQVPSATEDTCAWVRRSIFDAYLGPFGGAIGAALALKGSPSEQALEEDWMRRWFGVVMTGRLILLIGSINQHTSFGASFNKAIHVARETDGNDKEIKALLKQLGYPGIYDSSLKKAWRTFKPVAHLCGAYVITELLYRGEKLFREIFRDFAKYWRHPALVDLFTAFSMYCTFGRFIEEFATSFRPHGRRDPLISTEEIYSLDRNFGFTLVFKLSFPPLTEEEIAALKGYSAPKSLV
jgi:hypothetical protein